MSEKQIKKMMNDSLMKTSSGFSDRVMMRILKEKKRAQIPKWQLIGAAFCLIVVLFLGNFIKHVLSIEIEQMILFRILEVFSFLLVLFGLREYSILQMELNK